MSEDKKGKRGYATVSAEAGVDYRTIADTMTQVGWTMNHSSARNHVIRVMKKFAEAYAAAWGVDVSPDSLDRIARSPLFQEGVCDAINEATGTKPAAN